MSAIDDPGMLQDLYRIRFAGDAAAKSRLTTWQVLCDKWFPEFVRPTDVVVELGAGGCEFINNIKATRRIAVDLNPDVAAKAGEGVEFLQCSASDLSSISSGTVDVVFSSNFFEHLGTADVLLAVLGESRRVLKPGGTVITLMPNLSALGSRYFDFLDHTLPLTHHSLEEALLLAGYTPELIIPRFLPFTANNLKRPVSARAVEAYLRAKPAWRVLGKQMFAVARKPY